MIRVHVEAVGLRGPGLAGWAASAPILAGDEPYRPAPVIIPAATLLPANERRRAPRSVNLALAVGAEAFASAGLAPSAALGVFTSSGGDGGTIHAILETLAGADRALSPIRFHNSVHNVAAGYWSIATGARTPTTSLCAHDGSFAAGLLEAGVQAAATGGPVVLIAYDLPYPGPLAAARHIPEVFGVALLLSSAPEAPGRRPIALSLGPPPDRARTALPPALEHLRQCVPAARCLPLLAALARGEAATVGLDYLDDLALIVQLVPQVPA